VEWLVPTPSKRAGRAGVSLFEAVVAIAIVGITSVSALEAVGGDMRTAERARRAIEAEALASSRLEFMDLLTDRELQAIPDSVAQGKFPVPLDEYTWKTTSTPLSDQAGIYDIRVTIEWPTSSYVVKTYQYRRPPLVTRR
jgi:type II secretory pathway pseudopilin PulG